MTLANDFRKARRHLSIRDPVLRRLIATVGPCRLRQNPNRFAALVRSIISQQISTKAAASIAARLEHLLGQNGISPSKIMKVSDEALRATGLSAAKVRSLRDLAEKVRRRVVPLTRLHEMSDEEVVDRLVPVTGIGRWTAEMFLIFSLGRFDILPVSDLGLRSSVQRHYGLDELPVKDQLTELAEPWRPYRSIATWYLWRSLAVEPQLVK
jgi:DNA-3-methyladenine glycosylase II